MNEKNKLSRSLIGTVVSNKMTNTIIVKITRNTQDPVCGKYMLRWSKIPAHTEEVCQIGDVVAIEECKPISKRKSWKLTKIVERAAEQ